MRREKHNPTVIPFKSAHLDLMAWRQFDTDYTITLPTFKQQLEAYCENSLSVTVCSGGRIMACGGILPLGGGVAYCWLFGSTYLPQCSLWFIRELIKWLRHITDDFQIHRLQTVCHVDDIQGQKWVESLGFIAEGTLRMYDANKGDYIMYARLNDKEESNGA